jgi:hypothetical protein
MWRFLVIGAASGAAVAPMPAAMVERFYSAALYPALQQGLTGASNLLPFALFDALLLGAVAGWAGLLLHDVMRGRDRWMRTIVRVAVRTLTAAAAFYLVFLATWGLNYRRVPLVDKLEFDATRISEDAVAMLARSAVAEANRLHASASRTAATRVERSLADAFERAQATLGTGRTARPARPKHSLLDLYFRRTAVDGMTDPYFLETLVVSNLLPFERPFVVAHEWGHLAGYADEGEANFVGWLTCLRGSPAAQYSAWLFLYREVIGALAPADRQTVAGALAEGPRADVRAIEARIREHVSPVVSAAGWEVYDRYLRANYVDAGTASYAEVIRLIVGTRFAAAQVPALR